MCVGGYKICVQIILASLTAALITSSELKSSLEKMESSTLILRKTIIEVTHSLNLPFKLNSQQIENILSLNDIFVKSSHRLCKDTVLHSSSQHTASIASARTSMIHSSLQRFEAKNALLYQSSSIRPSMGKSGTSWHA